jgi:curved DNA-binding protein CbpA
MSASSGDPAAARAAIARMARVVEAPNHFDVLGVDPETPLDEVKARYTALARKWHVDAFAGLGLPREDLARVDAIFKRIGQAWEVLRDPQARSEHLVYLERMRAGLSTEVADILRAEPLIDEALAEIRRRQYRSAQDKLEEASRLNPDDPLIRAHLAWAKYRGAGGTPAAAASARAELKASIEKQENLPEALRYLGTIAFEQGELAKAIRWLDRCLEWAPKDVDAARLLRLARSRKEKQKKPGGLAGLLSKLTKKS